MSKGSRSYRNCSGISTSRNSEAGSNWPMERCLWCSRACWRYGQALGQSSVTSRCSPQLCAQMRPCTAGQKRFSLRISQMAQLKAQTPVTSLWHSEAASGVFREPATLKAHLVNFCLLTSRKCGQKGHLGTLICRKAHEKALLCVLYCLDPHKMGCFPQGR